MPAQADTRCSQRVFAFHSGLTEVRPRQHKHFEGYSNMSDTLGPFSWPTVATLPMLSLADKRLFWDARRKAVGGRSVETAGSASGEDDNDDDDEESEGEAPAVLPDAENMAEEKKAAWLQPRPRVVGVEGPR